MHRVDFGSRAKVAPFAGDWREGHGQPLPAKRQAQLDPLHPAPRDPDFAHEHSWRYGSDDKRFTDELQRLLGHRWEKSDKLP